jgi:hypothetical protein
LNGEIDWLADLWLLRENWRFRGDIFPVVISIETPPFAVIRRDNPEIVYCLYLPEINSAEFQTDTSTLVFRLRSPIRCCKRHRRSRRRSTILLAHRLRSQLEVRLDGDFVACVRRSGFIERLIGGFDSFFFTVNTVLDTTLVIAGFEIAISVPASPHLFFAIQ